MFPKAHATAYVTMAVRVAWFKVHYPLEYYATFFSLRAKQFDLETMMKSPKTFTRELDNDRLMNKTQRIKLKPKDEEILYTLQMALEMAERGYRVANIDIDRSDASLFLADHDNNALIPPFVVVDGIG
jgi:DNA polymerase-3 subunit alpha (Gram-positive type)